MSVIDDARPGDGLVVRTPGWAARVIRFGMWLAGYPAPERFYNHVVCVTAPGQGVEARPSGAGKVALADYTDCAPLLIRSGLADAEAAVAVHFWRRRVGTGYGWLDIAAQAWAASRLPTPAFVWRRLERTDRFICSQLLAEGWLRAGRTLFDCPPSEVTPPDVACAALGLPDPRLPAAETTRTGD